jgi:hypothetical protein
MAIMTGGWGHVTRTFLPPNRQSDLAEESLSFGRSRGRLRFRRGPATSNASAALGMTGEGGGR